MQAIVVAAMAIAAPYIMAYYYKQLDPVAYEALELDMELRYSQLFLLVIVGVLIRFFFSSKTRILLLLMVIGAMAAVPFALKQPGVSEKVLRAVVTAAGIPETLWNHVQILDDTIWYDLLTRQNLGVAENYMHGKLQVDPLPFFLTVLNGSSLGTNRKQVIDVYSILVDTIRAPFLFLGRVVNLQSLEMSKRVTEQHYDVGNDLYEKMLGPSMSYTCAYWKDAKNLDAAQTAKFDLILRKLQIPKGSKLKIADLGMGWGTLARHVHTHAPADVDVHGVSLSKEQVRWATDNLAKPGLTFHWTDYRKHCEDPANHGTYDRVYSIGMLEHVGFKNHEGFFRCVKKLLKPDGLAVIHTIGEPDFLPVSDDFLDKYIFPGAVIPTLSSLTAAFEDIFILEDFHNFGHDYAPTLAAWNVNAEKFFADNPKAYTPEFQRMWHYYLKMCEALFELRINQLWHFVLSPRPAMRKGIERQL